MQCEGTKGSVVWVREAVNDCMQGVSPDDIIIVLYITLVSLSTSHRYWSVRTSSFDEPSIMLGCQERVWKIAEELL